MTKVVIFKSKSHILGFEISGHSGYAEEGSDIVCSAISSISQMVVVGIKDVLKIGAFVEISNGYLKLNLSQKDAENAAVLEISAGMAMETEMLGGRTPVGDKLLAKHYLRKHGKNAYYGQK